MGNKSCTWLTTGEICHALSVSRSKLCRSCNQRTAPQTLRPSMGKSAPDLLFKRKEETRTKNEDDCPKGRER